MSLFHKRPHDSAAVDATAEKYVSLQANRITYYNMHLFLEYLLQPLLYLVEEIHNKQDFKVDNFNLYYNCTKLATEMCATKL
jgi:hypothetical protein